MKFCKDCKFYEYDVGFNYCLRKQKTVKKYQSLVTGALYTKPGNSGIEYAHVERNAWFFGCGKNAKYFEKKA